MQKQLLSFVIKKADKATGDITIVASDETVDRVGESIPIESWDLRNYKKNPVLLVDHDYKVSNIVGRAKNLRVDKEQRSLTFSPDFHDITQLAREVDKMVFSDFAPAVSVGFLPRSDKKQKDKVWNELLEISFVAVGANPNALSLAMKSINDDQKKMIEDWLAKAPEIVELQRIELDKKIFDTKEKAQQWMVAHDYFMDDFEETDTKYIFNQFAKALCELDTENPLDLEDGAVAYSCRPKKQDPTELAAKVEDLTGKVIGLINDISALKQTAEAEAQEKAAEKSRQTKMEHEARLPKKIVSPVVRALQSINKQTNVLLREFKD